MLKTLRAPLKDINFRSNTFEFMGGYSFLRLNYYLTGTILYFCPYGSQLERPHWGVFL
jgi:hypothetical protein